MTKRFYVIKVDGKKNTRIAVSRHELQKSVTVEGTGQHFLVDGHGRFITINGEGITVDEIPYSNGNRYFGKPFSEEYGDITFEKASDAFGENVRVVWKSDGIGGDHMGNMLLDVDDKTGRLVIFPRAEFDYLYLNHALSNQYLSGLLDDNASYVSLRESRKLDEIREKFQCYRLDEHEESEWPDEIIKFAAKVRKSHGLQRSSE